MKGKKWTAVDSLYWLGGGLIALGAGLWSLPAGLVCAGVFCLLGGVLIDRAPNDRDPKDRGDDG